MKRKACLFLSIVMMVLIFAGCSSKKDDSFVEEDLSVDVKFTVDGYSKNETARAHVSINDYLKKYTHFTINSVDANDNTQYCILQSWDTVSNSAITLEQNVDYEITNETQNLIDIYSNVRSIADNSLARCVVTVNFHN